MSNFHSNQDLFALFEDSLEEPPSFNGNAATASSFPPQQNYDGTRNQNQNGNRNRQQMIDRNNVPTTLSSTGMKDWSSTNGNGNRQQMIDRNNMSTTFSSTGNKNGSSNGSMATEENNSSHTNGYTHSSHPETSTVQKAVTAIQTIRKEVEKSQNTIKTELLKNGAASNPIIVENLNQLDKLPSLLDRLGQFVQQFQGQLVVNMQQQIAAHREWLGALAQQMQQAETQNELFNIIVREVGDQLQADRVIIFNFDTDNKGTVLAEAVTSGWTPMQGELLPALLFGAENAREYKHRQIVTLYHQDSDRMFAYQRQLLERFQLLASVAVPLVINDRVQGLLVVQQCRQSRTWQETEVYLLADVVAKLSLALQFVQFKMQLKQIAAREQASGKVIQKIRSTVDVEAIFRVTTQEVSRLLNVERVTIYKFRPDFFGDFVEETITGNYPRLVGSGWEDPYLSEHRGGRFRNNVPLVVEDIHVGEVLWEGGRLNAQAPRKPMTDCHIEALEYYQVKACAVVAIFQGNKLWGLLSAFQNTGTRQWEEAEVQLLTRIANQLGFALQQAESVEEAQTKALKLQKGIEREQALARVVNRIRNTLDIDTIFKAATQEIRSLLNVERVTIYKFRPDFFGDFIAESVTGGYPSLAGSGWEDPYINEHEGGRFRQNIPLIVNDIYAGEILWEGGRLNMQALPKPMTDCHVEALEYYQVKACAVVAIFQGTKLWGLLSAFQNTNTRVWEEEEVNLLMQVANQIGIGIQQAEYASQLQTRSQELAEALAREKASKELLQQRAVQLLTAVRPALKGDLTVRAPLTEDEMGTIADAYNNTLQALRKIVIQVQEAATRVSETSQSNSSEIVKLTQGAHKELQQMTAALTQIQDMVDGTQAVASSAQQVEIAVQQANQTVQQGDAAMNRTVEGIQTIRQTVSETSKKIKQLSESSQKISKVVNLISGFTTQTQLLALNAAIEATRAGEAGRGFAVVADEVRSLARQSAEATIEIEKLVQEIQAETSMVSQAMDAGIQQVVNGTALVNETRQSLTAIIGATAQISSLVQHITHATQAQTEDSRLVTQTMEEVVAITNETAVATQQIATSFEQLLTTASELQTTVGQFKL